MLVNIPALNEQLQIENLIPYAVQTPYNLKGDSTMKLSNSVGKTLELTRKYNEDLIAKVIQIQATKEQVCTQEQASEIIHFMTEFIKQVAKNI